MKNVVLIFLAVCSDVLTRAKTNTHKLNDFQKNEESCVDFTSCLF